MPYTSIRYVSGLVDAFMGELSQIDSTLVASAVLRLRSVETVVAAIARIGEPEDIAALVEFIASPDGKMLHGALIDMDAGATKTI